MLQRNDKGGRPNRSEVGPGAGWSASISSLSADESRSGLSFDMLWRVLTQGCCLGVCNDGFTEGGTIRKGRTKGERSVTPRVCRVSEQEFAVKEKTSLFVSR